MTGDGSFFPDPPESQYSSHNAKSVLNYHPVLEFNGNKNDFWLLFDDSDILEKHESRPLRKPPKTSDPKSKGFISKPGFTNTFSEVSSSKSGFLRPKDDDNVSQKTDSNDRFADGPEGRQARLDRLTRSGVDTLSKAKEIVRDRRRSRSRERRRSNSRERRRSRSLERRRSRSPGRKRSPIRDRHTGSRRDYGSRRRSRSREGRGRDRSRSKDRRRTSRDRDWKRGSPSSRRTDSRSKRSTSVSSNTSNDGGRSEADKAGKDDLLKKFAEKLQEKAKSVNKSLSSIRLSSRLEDTKHRRAEPITPIVFSLKKAPIKSFPSTTVPQKVQDKKREEKKKDEILHAKEKSVEPMEISDPSETVSGSIEMALPTTVVPSIPTSVSQLPPPLNPPFSSVSHQAQPLRVTDGVTVACAPTLYKDGKKAPVSGAIIALPPAAVSRPSLTAVSQPSAGVVSQAAMGAPTITEKHQHLAAQALEYASIQQNVSMMPSDFGPMMRVPPGPPPGHGIRPGMIGRGHFGAMGPTPHGPEGPFMGPPHHGPEGPFMGPPHHGPMDPFLGPPPHHGLEGSFMGPPPHGPEGPFMGPPHHGPEGPFTGPPHHGPGGPYMGPPRHGPEGHFVGPPHYCPDGPFMGLPHHGPERPFMAPPPQGPEGPFMGRPPQPGPEGPFMAPPPYGVRPPFMGGPPQNTTAHHPTLQSIPTAVSQNVAARPIAEVKKSTSSKSTKENSKSSPPRIEMQHPSKATSLSPLDRKKHTRSKSIVSSLCIPNFEKLKFILGLIEFLQGRSDLRKQILALDKSPSAEFCIESGLLCRVKKESEDQVLVIMVPENENARRTIVTAFVLKYPDLDVEALIALFEQSFHNMPMEDIEDVFEDESTRSSTLLSIISADFSNVEEILPCGKVMHKGDSIKKDVKTEKANLFVESAKTESHLSSDRHSTLEEPKFSKFSDESVDEGKSQISESSTKNVKDEKDSACSAESEKMTDSLKQAVLQGDHSATELKAKSEKPPTSETYNVAQSVNVVEMSNSGKPDSVKCKSEVDEITEIFQAPNVTSGTSLPTESSVDDLNKDFDSTPKTEHETITPTTKVVAHSSEPLLKAPLAIDEVHNQDRVKDDTGKPKESTLGDYKLITSQVISCDSIQTIKAVNASDKSDSSLDRVEDAHMCSEELVVDPVVGSQCSNEKTSKPDEILISNYDDITKDGEVSNGRDFVESQSAEGVEVMHSSQPQSTELDESKTVVDSAVGESASHEKSGEPSSSVEIHSEGSDLNCAGSLSDATDLVTPMEEVAVINPEQVINTPSDESFHVSTTSASVVAKEEQQIVEETVMNVMKVGGDETSSTRLITKVSVEATQCSETEYTNLPKTLEPEVPCKSTFQDVGKVDNVEVDVASTKTPEVSSSEPSESPSRFEPSVEVKDTRSKEATTISSEKTIEPILTEQIIASSPPKNIDAFEMNIEEASSAPHCLNNADSSTSHLESAELKLKGVEFEEATSIITSKSFDQNLIEGTPTEHASVEPLEREGRTDVAKNMSNVGNDINNSTGFATSSVPETHGVPCESDSSKETSTDFQTDIHRSVNVENVELFGGGLVPKEEIQECEPVSDKVEETKAEASISLESTSNVAELKDTLSLKDEASENQIISETSDKPASAIGSDLPVETKTAETPSSEPALNEEMPELELTTGVSEVETHVGSSPEVPVVKRETKKEESSLDSDPVTAMDIEKAADPSKAMNEPAIESKSIAVQLDVVDEKVNEEAEVKQIISIQVKGEPTATDIEHAAIDLVKSDITTSTTVPRQKSKFSKCKSTYELMKSMDLGEPKKLYNESDSLVIVNYEKLSFFTSRLKEIQKSSDIAVLTSKIVFIPFSASDQFVMKNGLLCKHKDLQKNDVFIVLLKSTLVYREIVSALTEQYPDLDFNEFMSLIDSSFTYITPDEIKSLSETIDQKMVYLNYHNFIERCNIANFDIVQTMLEQLRTMQQADIAIAHRYSRLRANGGLDDSYILKYDLVCQFVGTLDFKVWLPKSQPDQIAVMYIVHETNHNRGLVEFLELMRATFEGVNVSLIDKPVALCSICCPPATAGATSIVKACEQKCTALKSLPPEVIFKIRQVQMASSVFKAQIDLLTKGQSRQGSKYILDTSLLCKSMTKGNQEVYRVVVSPSGLKEVVSLLHTTYHRKSLDDFVSFVNDFMAITKEVCKAAFQECQICMKNKTPKTSVDSQKAVSTSKTLERKRSDPPMAEENECSKKETIASKDDSKTAIVGDKSQSTANDVFKGKKSWVSFKEASRKDVKGGNKDTAKVSIGKTKEQESAMMTTQETRDAPENELPKDLKSEATRTWEVKEKASLPPKTPRGEKIRREVMRDLRTFERIWGRELGDRIRNLLRFVPDRVLTEIVESQKSCSELMRSIKVLERAKPVRDAKEMLCGGILFTLKSRTKPKVAVKPIKHVNYSLITKIHSEVHDWSVNKIHGTIGVVFDISPSKEEVEQTINWFCQKCGKSDTQKKQKIYNSLDEQLEDFYKSIEPILNQAKVPKESESLLKNSAVKKIGSEDDETYKEICKDLLTLDKIWGRELGEKIKAAVQPIPEKLHKAVITAQRECSELAEIIDTVGKSTPVKDARHVLCGGILFVIKSKKKAMMVKIHVKPIKNINYILITNLHDACHDWTVNRLQTVIGVSFDVSPTREEVAVTIEWFCLQCQKPDTTSRRKKTACSLEEQLKDLYDTIDLSVLKSKDNVDDQEANIDLTEEIPLTDIRLALAKLPSPVVSKIQLSQMQSNVLNTQIKLLENTDGPVKDKRHCLVMSLLCKLIELNGKLTWRVMIPSDILKELVAELHTVHYHDMIQEDFSEFVNTFMTVPEDMLNELFSTCTICMNTVRRVPTLCERGINEDLLRKTLATIAEMIESVIKWQTECPAIVKIIEGVKKCRSGVIAEYLLYKDILFKLCGKTKGGKAPRPKIAVSVIPNAVDEVIKSTHAFYHSNNPNQLMNLINVTFDVTVHSKTLITKIPELCIICRKKSETAKQGDTDTAGPANESSLGSTDEATNIQDLGSKGSEPNTLDPSAMGPNSTVVVKEEMDSPVEVEAEEPTPLGVLLLGRLCDQVIEESSNSSRALDSPVPEMPSTSDEIPVVRRTCKVILQRCKYDPNIVQGVGEVSKKKKNDTEKVGAKRSKKPKNMPKIQEGTVSGDESDTGSESALPKRKFVVYSSDSETEESTTSKKRKAIAGPSQNPKRKK